MKPNFALNLSHEGICLLHRSKAGWMHVGDVQLDSPDLHQQLGMLRQTAANLDQTGLSTKLVIPDSQILFTEITAPGPDETTRQSQIREGLVGLTPYDVDDLVFDWREVPTAKDRVQVAVVARETLREAEAFAAEFRFNPISYVGFAGPDNFDGEPFFGTTEGAKTILEGGDTVEPDEVATKIIGPAQGASRPKAAANAEHQAPVAPPVPEAKKAKKPKAKPKKAPAPTPEAIEETTDTETSPEVALPTFSSRRRDDTSPPAPEPALVAPKDVAASPAPSVDPKPAEAETVRDTVTRYSALDLDDVPDLPHWQPVGAPDAPEPPNLTSGHIPGPADPAPNAQGGASAASMPDRQASGSISPVVAASAGASTRRLRDRKAAIAASSKEAKSLTVFGAREAPVVGGKPKYLGLMLTVLLLLAFGVAALWSSLFVEPEVSTAPEDDGQISLLSPSEPILAAPIEETTLQESNEGNSAPAETETVETAPNLDTTSPEVSNPTAPGAETAGAPGAEQENSALSTAIDTAVDTALGTAPAAETALPPTNNPAPLADTEPSNTEPSPSENTAGVEVARLQQPDDTTDLSQAPPPDRVTEAPPTLAQAQTRYAATGIWQLDPNPINEPRGGDRLEQLLFASIDPGLQTGDAAILPQAGPDPRPSSLAPPLPLGADVELDERGLVVATPEGTLSPNGTVIYLGRPPIIPGVRPGTPAPDPAPAPAEDVAILDATSGDEPQPETAPAATPEETELVADPASPSSDEEPQELAAPELPALAPDQQRVIEVRPKARPGEFEETFNQSPSGEGYTLEELAQIRPRIRPPSIQEEIAADAEPEVDESEISEPEASELAIASSGQPRVRPRSVERRAARVIAQRVEEETPAQTNAEREDEQRQVAAAVVPTAPARASVSRAATERNVINLKKVNLIGVYGSPSDRRALVRLKSGRLVKVEVGDRVDGGRVAAIGSDELRYIKGGRNITLRLPKG